MNLIKKNCNVCQISFWLKMTFFIQLSQWLANKPWQDPNINLWNKLQGILLQRIWALCLVCWDNGQCVLTSQKDDHTEFFTATLWKQLTAVKSFERAGSWGQSDIVAWLQACVKFWLISVILLLRFDCRLFKSSKFFVMLTKSL